RKIPAHPRKFSELQLAFQNRVESRARLRRCQGAESLPRRNTPAIDRLLVPRRSRVSTIERKSDPPSTLLELEHNGREVLLSFPVLCTCARQTCVRRQLLKLLSTAK